MALEVRYTGVRQLAATDWIADRPNNAPPFMDCVSNATRNMTVLVTRYKEALAGDGRVLGPERTDLMSVTEESVQWMARTLAAALSIGSRAHRLMSSEGDLAINGTTDAVVVYFSRTGAWRLHGRLPAPFTPSNSIGAVLSGLHSEPLAALLQRLREFAADNKLDQAEADELLPLIVDCLLYLCGVYLHIQSCGSST